MGETWRPTRGQLALLEVGGDGGTSEDCEDERLTGLVLDVADRLVLDLGASPRRTTPAFDVVASFFVPEALYRVRGRASYRGRSSVVELSVEDVERVQRRSAARARVSLPVEVNTLDEPVHDPVRQAQTVDVAPGGCRLATSDRIPEGSDPAISIRLPDGAAVIAVARVLEEQSTGDGYEYRLSFAAISPPDAERLGELPH